MVTPKPRSVLVLGVGLSALVLGPMRAGAGPGEGEVWAVDGDADCGGDGSDLSPFCSLQEAFDNPMLGPGDRIQLYTAATPYAGATAQVAGAMGAPIVLEAAPDQLPIISGQLELVDTPYWHVTGLQFELDPAGGMTPIWARGNAPMPGIVIAGNTILNGGSAPGGSNGAGIRLSSSGSDGHHVIEPIVEDNLVWAARGVGIWLGRVEGAIVRRNVVTEQRCGGDGRLVGILSENGLSNQITRNRVIDFDLLACESEDLASRIMGITVVGEDEGQIDHNLVRNIATRDGGCLSSSMGCASLQGVTIANNSDEIDIDHNIITAVGSCGMCLGTSYSGSGDDLRIVANTLLDAGNEAIHVTPGTGPLVVRNNIMVGDRGALLRVQAPEALVDVDDNLYWHPSAQVGICGNGGDPADLEQWRRDCGVDAGSLFEDPLLPARFARTDDFTPPSDSAAVDAGGTIDGLVDAFHGRAADLGALEAPVASDARIEAESPTQVRFSVDSTATGDLLYQSGCEGFAVTLDGEPGVLSGCARESIDLIELTLAEPAVAGQEVDLVYDGTITDVAAIGGIIGARLQPFVLPVDNGAPPGPPGDSGEVDSTGGESADGTTTATTATEPTTGSEASDGTGETTVGQGESGGGCSCRSATPVPDRWAVWALTVLGLRRRATRKSLVQVRRAD